MLALKKPNIVAFLIAISPCGFLSNSLAASAQEASVMPAIYNQCRACHQVGETAKNGVGPHLNGLFGRKAGSVSGYNYSDAYKALDKTWSEDSFATYIQDPRGVTPGTKMIYAGVKDKAKIDELIAFLKRFDANGKTVP